MCTKSVSTMIEPNSVGDRDGSCQAWREESQQLFCSSHYSKREGIWKLVASVSGGRVTQIDISGTIDECWIKKVLEELKRSEHDTEETKYVGEDGTCDIQIDQNLERMHDQVKISTALERKVLRQYLKAVITRYTNQPLIGTFDLFRGWNLHHNRGVGLLHVLRPKYLKIRKAIVNDSNSEGTLLPVTEFARWATIITILLSTTAVFLAVLFTGPPKQCDVVGCYRWEHSEAIVWALGFLLSLITTSELLFGQEKGIGALCRGRIRLRGYMPMWLWCGVTKAQILSLM